MTTAASLKKHYAFTPEDEKTLKDLHPVMQEHRDRFSEDFSEFVMSHEEMASFFANEEKTKRHRMLMAAWFMRLFGGTYDEAYFRNLRHVGKVHVDIELEGHFVNAAAARVRRFIAETIEAHVPASGREGAALSVNKILDMNLDVLTSSYRQGELQKFFLSQRVEGHLVNWMARFSHGLNLILAVALGVVSLAVVGLFAHDVYGIFRSDHLEASVVAALGSLLIIWMMIELLDTEVSHLKGRKIPIKLFVGVVIVAFIRKVLVGTLQHENLMDYASRVVTLLILGVVYWLISRADKA